MVSKTIVVTNPTGIHARPAAMFVKTAAKFKSTITIMKGTGKGSAKSLISILGLAIHQNDKLTIIADGIDEKEALLTLTNLIESRFGE